MEKIIAANSVWSKKLGNIKCIGQCLGARGWLPVSHGGGPDSPPSRLTGLIRMFAEFCSLEGKPGHYLRLPTAAIYNINTYKISDSDHYICYINIINANSLTIF